MESLLAGGVFFVLAGLYAASAGAVPYETFSVACFRNAELFLACGRNVPPRLTFHPHTRAGRRLALCRFSARLFCPVAGPSPRTSRAKGGGCPMTNR